MWQVDTIASKNQMFCGKPFKAERGTRLGDNISSIFLNVVIATIVQYFYARMGEIEDKEITI